MVSAETKSIVERAKRIYAEQLRAELETRHPNRFVAIEPESGEYFLGDTFDEAVKLASAKHPGRLCTPSGSAIARPFTWGVCSGERFGGRSPAGTAPRTGVVVPRRGTQRLGGVDRYGLQRRPGNPA